ncbi:MAG: response regulator [Rubrivivax sp.]|nr:response regulator [Rubrivivax sp.]
MKWPGRWSAGPAAAGVWLAALVLLAGTLAVGAAVLEGGRRAALAKADALLRQMVGAAESGVNRTLLGVDLELAALPRQLMPAVIPPGGFDGEMAHQLLAMLQDSQLDIADLALVDEAGTTLTTALVGTRRIGLEMPPGLVGRVRGQAAGALVVSEPVIGRATGERSLLLARPVDLPGAPPLVGLAEVPSVRLLNVATGEATPGGLQVRIEREDGLVLAMQPPDDRIIGQRATAPVRPADATGQSRAIAGRVGAAEPVREAARPTLYPGLFVVVSLPQQVALAEWRDTRRVVLAVAAAIAALLLAAAAGTHWQLRRLAEARRAAAFASTMLDQALASMGDAFLLCDADDRVLRWNQRYLQLFPWLEGALYEGASFESLAQAAARALYPQGTQAEREAWMAWRMDAHRRCDRPWEQVLVGGVAVHAVERRLPDGGVVGVYRDLSATERKLSDAKQAAEAANDAKSRFLANMSHEIRTPLNAVLGLNELLLRSPLDVQQRRHAELVRSSGQLLLALVNDVLDLSRIDAGHFELQPVEFDPRRLATEVLALLQERADAQNLQLELELDPALPAALSADATRLRQVLLNLVGNALKFTERGHVRVRLGGAAEGGVYRLDLRVEDTGIGIPPEAMPTLFDRFTQADATAARRRGGSGLGLAITREVVQRMGGQIGVQSEPGRGSTFTVTLPCVAVTAAPPAPVARVGEPGAAGGLDVLVVEDNAVNQLVIEAMLRHLGHRPVVVADGRSAVERAGQGGWHLVLMDMQMPEQDGLSATRAIRALGGPAAAVPIVAITANARPEDRQACLDAGMDAHLSKPIDVEALKDALAMAAERRNGP